MAEKDPKVIISIDTKKLTSKALPRVGTDHFAKQVSEIAEIARKVTQVHMPVINAGLRGFIAQNTKLFESITAAQKSAVQSITKIAQSGVFDAIQRSVAQASQLTQRLQSHFPANWPSSQMGKCADLCMRGMPIILVPRTQIVSKIIAAKNLTGAKQVIVHNDSAILEDCKKAIDESTWLSKDMKLQIMESLDCYEDKKYRAAQSTANVAFDSLLNEVIDIRAWRRSNSKPKELSARKVKQLTEEFTGDLMELPLTRAPFYTLLMFPIIGSVLAPFEIGDRTTHVNHYNRHMSAHTVSSKQYKRSNALIAIMAVATVCKITQLRGKNWMQLSAKEYGVGIS